MAILREKIHFLQIADTMIVCICAIVFGSRQIALPTMPTWEGYCMRHASNQLKAAWTYWE
jgi:hypothetical protein